MATTRTVCAMQTDREAQFSRVLLAFTGDAADAALIEAAVQIAQALRTEVSGLYVREEVLSDIAALQVSAVVAAGGARSGRVTQAAVERHWRRTTETCRRTLSVTAEGARVAWSFESVSGALGACLCGQAGRGDLIALAGGWSGLTSGEDLGLVRDAAALAGAVMIAGQPTAQTPAHPGPVLAIDDGDAAGRRTVALAARLAAALGRDLAVLAVGEGERVEAIAERARGLAAGRPVKLHQLPSWLGRDLAEAVRRIAPSLSVADLQASGIGESALAGRLLRRLPGPMVLLGGQGAADTA